MEVIWDSERFFVDLPVGSFTLGSFKRYLTTRTGVPAEHMKLFCNAGLMKDDSMPLSSYQPEVDTQLDPGSQSSSPLTRSRLWSGIFSGNKKRQLPPMRIRMVGAKETRSIVSDRPDLKPTPTSNLNLPPPQLASNLQAFDQPRVVLLINELTQKTLMENSPRVERYEGMLSTGGGGPDDSASPEEPSDNPITSHVHPQWDPTEIAGLSEMLLQALLKLDGFEIESEWTDARMARKEGVRAVQQLLERLDRVKAAAGPQKREL
ncbi:hypothetical protein VP01_942g1 [Puccinia sorghi]|uniref:BAG domain-containing protein n=1 Tax=Puccinia sorghi TaxID=27349 RepID=A0A0L6U6N5_9BASI|nr:hypothetical protein VP01_942g1 [Puccinia sorghi]